MPGGAMALELAPGRAYVATRSVHRSVRVVDVTDPAAPREIGALRMPDDANGVALADGLAFATSSGLRVLEFGPEYDCPPGRCERPARRGACGLGFEVALLLPVLMRLRASSRRRVGALARR